MDPQRTTLIETRHAALAIHQALLHATARAFERHHGRIESGSRLLDLATGNPEFAWLQPLTGLIASLDAAIHAGDAESLARGRVLARAIVDLLRGDSAGGPFQARYLREVQASPDVALIAAQARCRLQAVPPVWT